MAKRVTEKDIIDINEAYLLCKTYSAVAEATGWSASTVRKYIIPNYTSKVEKVAYNIKPLNIEDTIKKLVANEAICSVSPEEKEELNELWKDMLV